MATIKHHGEEIYTSTKPTPKKPRRNMKRFKALKLTAADLRSVLVPAKPLSNLATARLKPEETEALRCKALLTELTLTGRLNAVWTHVPNESPGRGRVYAMWMAIKRAMGLVPGMGDYIIMPQGPAFLCELKVGKNTMSDPQIVVSKWCRDIGIHYYEFHTAEELEQILIDERVLTA